MIIFRYILAAHVLPFIFAVFTLMSVFLLQFFMKFADRLIGKGLSTMVIIQLVTYNLAWMLVLVIPMAVLISTLMAFGTLSQNNEIAVLKAAGMSLYKMMLPPLLGSIIVALFLVWFNNNIYPDANHAARVLAYDISRKKPTLSLVPGVFSQEIPGKSILARSIDPKTNEMGDLTIYDRSDPKTINIVTAKRGKLYFVKNQTKLVLDLYNGEIHTSNVFDNKDYRKILFKRHKIVMDADEFSFSQSSAQSMRRGDRELGAPAMRKFVDSLEIIRKRYQSELDEKIDNNFLPKLEIKNLKPEQTIQTAKLKVASTKSDVFTKSKKYIYLRVGDKIKTAKGSLRSSTRRLQYNKERIDNYWVEIHKKYSIPFACILFILVGAPLGTMTRKGGFGVASGISLIFFLMYWAFLIGGEKLSDRALLSPLWGTWSANVVLLFIGAYLTYKSAKERVTIDFSFLQKLVPKSLRSKKEEDEDN